MPEPYATTRPAAYDPVRFAYLSDGKPRQTIEADHREAVRKMGDGAHKPITIGQGAVGKTTLLITYTTGERPTEDIPTVFDNYCESAMIDGETVDIGLWDTEEREDYDGLRPLSYPGTTCFLLCFDIACRSSFENIKWKWHHEIHELLPSVPFLLIGCKRDLRQNEEVLARLREKGHTVVGAEEAQALARELGAVAYLECSSNEDSKETLGEIFAMAVRAGRKHKSSHVGGGRPRKRCVVM